MRRHTPHRRGFSLSLNTPRLSLSSAATRLSPPYAAGRGFSLSLNTPRQIPHVATHHLGTMFNINQRDHLTIAAIASGQAPAAIGVLRLSGQDAFSIIEKCIHKKNLKNRSMHYRTLFDPNSDEPLDDVMLCRFQHPNSFTGEDTVEIYAHGGSINLSRILKALVDAGAVLANPGEFSQRAFLNGKMDLARAEAIMDVIHAQNEIQCREAHRQLSGSVSKVVSDLRDSIMKLLIAVEASIDFSTEEELAPFPEERIRNESTHLLSLLERMERAHEQYRAGGLRIALMGRPNAGKSSLFNHLLGHERAIVTDIAGTTTDTIEAHTVIQKHDFTLIDTAGLTQTNNVIEKLGVDRSRQQLENTDILLILIPANATCDEHTAIENEIQALGDNFNELNQQKRVFCIRTKSDLTSKTDPSPLPDSLLQYHFPQIITSVFNGNGIKELENQLATIAEDIENHRENVALITSQRHITHIKTTHQAIQRVISALDQHLPAECVAEDLREAADALGEITGTIASEDVLNQIFSHFCIGK